MKQKNEIQPVVFSSSIKEIHFTSESSDLASIDFRTGGVVCLKMRDRKKLVYSEQNKPRYKTEATGEEVVEYSGVATDGKKEKSWAIVYFVEGGYSPNHYHDDRTETYFITDGEAKLVIDGKEFLLKAGDSMTITPKQKHQIFNIGKTKLELIVECTPAWIFSDHHLEQSLHDNKLNLI